MRRERRGETRRDMRNSNMIMLIDRCLLIGLSTIIQITMHCRLHNYTVYKCS